MVKRLVIEPYLSVEELENHYRATSDPIERTRYHIIWLLAFLICNRVHLTFANI